MKVTICIGSYCHVKGAPQVIAELQRLVEEAGVKDYVELAGKFCMKRCQEGNAQASILTSTACPTISSPRMWRAFSSKRFFPGPGDNAELSDSVKRGASRAGIARRLLLCLKIMAATAG